MKPDSDLEPEPGPIPPYHCPVCSRAEFPRAADTFSEERDWCADCDRIIHEHWDAAEWAHFLLAEVRAVLDQEHASENCHCPTCTAAKAAAAWQYQCDRCGYRGEPAAAECACYDSSCRGGAHRGAGCFHGALVCPVCEDGEGELDPWDLLKQVRKALASGPAPLPPTAGS